MEELPGARHKEGGMHAARQNIAMYVRCMRCTVCMYVHTYFVHTSKYAVRSTTYNYGVQLRSTSMLDYCQAYCAWRVQEVWALVTVKAVDGLCSVHIKKTVALWRTSTNRRLHPPSRAVLSWAEYSHVDQGPPIARRHACRGTRMPALEQE